MACPPRPSKTFLFPHLAHTWVFFAVVRRLLTPNPKNHSASSGVHSLRGEGLSHPPHLDSSQVAVQYVSALFPSLRLILVPCRPAFLVGQFAALPLLPYKPGAALPW